VDELEILQSALAEGQSPKAIARSWEGLLPGRTLRAIEIRCQRLHGPIRGFNTSEDNELLLKLVEEGLTIIEICARLPHRRRSYVNDVIKRYKVVPAKGDPSSRVPWTADEDAIITHGMALGKRPFDIAAELPGRSIARVDVRMLKLQQFGGQVRKPRKP